MELQGHRVCTSSPSLESISQPLSWLYQFTLPLASPEGPVAVHKPPTCLKIYLNTVNTLSEVIPWGNCGMLTLHPRNAVAPLTCDSQLWLQTLLNVPWRGKVATWEQTKYLHFCQLHVNDSAYLRVLSSPSELERLPWLLATMFPLLWIFCS